VAVTHCWALGVLFLAHAGGGASHHYIALHDRGYVENPTIFFLFTSSSLLSYLCLDIYVAVGDLECVEYRFCEGCIL
jgi:hypothetical protein